MPTSQSEANTIMDITLKYITPEQAIPLFDELYEVVGATTDNESLKVSLEMMKQLSDSLKKAIEER